MIDDMGNTIRVAPRGEEFVLGAVQSGQSGYSYTYLRSTEDDDEGFNPGEVRNDAMLSADNPVFVLLLLFLSCNHRADWDVKIAREIIAYKKGKCA